MNTLHYYFALMSPFTFLGHDELLGIIDGEDVQVQFYPLKVGPLFAASGGVPVGQRPPQRQAYRLAELRRWSARKEIPLNVQPKHFPVDETLAACCVLVLQEQGLSPWDFIGRAHRVVWTEDRNLSDPAIVEELLTASGHDADTTLALARSETTLGAYAACTDAAIEAGVFGAPTYVMDGELLWGQDRLEFLESMLNR